MYPATSEDQELHALPEAMVKSPQCRPIQHSLLLKGLNGQELLRAVKKHQGSFSSPLQLLNWTPKKLYLEMSRVRLQKGSVKLSTGTRHLNDTMNAFSHEGSQALHEKSLTTAVLLIELSSLELGQRIHVSSQLVQCSNNSTWAVKTVAIHKQYTDRTHWIHFTLNYIKYTSYGLHICIRNSSNLPRILQEWRMV